MIDQAQNREKVWPLLDLSRIAAALLVLIGHTRYLYFGTPTAIAHSGLGRQIFYFFTGLSREAVVVFFVISGFLVGGQIIELSSKGIFDVWAYLINRFSRIYIVLIPALVLAFVFSWVGAKAFAGTSSHTDLLEGWSDFSFPCFLACLQGIECKAHANPPLWSLGYEWLIYLSAPAFFGICFSSFDKPLRFAALILFGVIFYAMFADHIEWEWFLFWLIGTAANRLTVYRSLPTAAGIVGLVTVAIALAAARSKEIPLLAAHIVIAIGFALVISSRLLLAWNWWPKVTARLAGISYSLYAVHLPVVVFVAELLEWLGWASPVPNESVEAGMDFFVSIAAALLIAAGFAAMTEARTATVRRMILNCRHSSNGRELARLRQDRTA